jgi:hypothetical protein
MGDAASAVRQRDADVLHDALVLVIENVAKKHEIADIAPVAAADDHRVSPGGPPWLSTKIVSLLSARSVTPGDMTLRE